MCGVGVGKRGQSESYGSCEINRNCLTFLPTLLLCGVIKLSFSDRERAQSPSIEITLLTFLLKKQ